MLGQRAREKNISTILQHPQEERRTREGRGENVCPHATKKKWGIELGGKDTELKKKGKPR